MSPEIGHSSHSRLPEKTVESSTRPALIQTIAIVVILLAGIVFRAAYLIQPVGNDEAYTFLGFAIKPLFSILTDYSHPNNHIFHTLLVAGITRLFGNEIWIMRLPAFLAGIGEIWLIYLVGKKLLNTHAGLIASALMAASPIGINYSAEARGYTLIGCFSLLLFYLAMYLVDHSKPKKWVWFVVTGAFGMYTIPTMLYPIAVVYLWILIETFRTHRNTQAAWPTVKWIIVSGLGMIALTLLLYSPVIIWGTGLRSIAANGNILPEDWLVFLTNLVARSRRTWEEWQAQIPLALTILALIGFVASFLPNKRNRQRLHLILAFIPAIAIILILQRVAPWPRIWHFAMCWYLLYCGYGWSNLLGLLTFNRQKLVHSGLVAIIVMIPMIYRGAAILVDDSMDASRQPGVEEITAGLIQENLQPNEVVLSVVPISTQIKFYVYQRQPYDKMFYNTSIQQPFDTVMVVVSDKYENTLESVIERNGLLDLVDLSSAKQLAVYKHVKIYRVNDIQ